MKLSDTIARSELFRRNAELANRRVSVDSRFALDPLAHLEAGHVLMLGLAEDDDPDAEEFGEEGSSILLKRVPFEPYQHEIELMHAWPDLDYLARTAKTGDPVLRWNNVHEEKSRQMGITWTAAYVLLWALTYHPTAALALHLKKSKVDDGGSTNTPESIFGRIRFMAESNTADGGSTWPEHVRPAAFLEFRGGNDPDVVNRLTGSRITGVGATEDPGRGGTYTNALIDEAARIPWGSAVQASLIRACPRGRFYNSTPHGKDNMYYGLKEPKRRSMIYLRHHWSVHPLYGRDKHVAGEDPDCSMCANTRAGVEWDATIPVAHRYPGKLTSPWYEEQILEMDDETVAQELDISYERSLEARVYPEFSAEVHVVPFIEFAPDVSIEFSWDYGADTTAVGIWQDYNDVLCKIGELEAHDMAPEDVAKALRNTLQDLGVPIAHTGPSFTRQMFMVGDVAGKQRQQATARTLEDDYRAQGFNINSMPQQTTRTLFAMKRLLLGRPKPIRYSAATCPKTIRHMEQNRYETDRHGNRKPSNEIKNDEHNHMCRADAYYVTWKFPPPRVDENDATPGSAFHWPTEASPYRKIDSWDDVPAGTSDPHRGVL